MVLFEESPLVVVAEAPVSRIWLNRAATQNVINLDMLRALSLAFDRLSFTEGVRAVILGSESEEAFSVGLDVRSMIDLGPAAAEEFFSLAEETISRIELFPVPVVAAVGGYAVGAGLELALACDMIVAGLDSRFGLSEPNFGMLPVMHGVENLCARCGRGVVTRLLCAGEIVDVEEAFRIGLVDVTVPADEVHDAARKIAREISARSPVALKAVKKTVIASRNLHGRESAAGRMELLQQVFASEDRMEGMRAFLQKRAPGYGTP